jgi:hypothetical protein
MQGPDINVMALMWFIKNQLATFISTLPTFIEMASTFIFGGNAHLCAVTFKVKVWLRWIQQLAMRASAFDESKIPG